MDYNDGLANEVQSWDYDAAGNRLTKVVGSSSTSYGWDAVNRMVETGPTSGSKTQYKYRADGMRVRKTGGGVTESVYYDGQMPVETFEDVSGSNDVLTQNFIGARGIEMIETKVGSGSPTRAYPLYDGHGNMVATLSTTGTAWTVGNERSYDVWGSVRSGATTGGPKGRYVANLGHVQDDESGLIYMRARYYEPGTGRFVSQDPACDGSNWYIYATNAPTFSADPDGMISEAALWGVVSILFMFFGLILGGIEFNIVGSVEKLIRHIDQLKSVATIENIASKFGFDALSDLASAEKNLAKESRKLRAARIGKLGAIGSAIMARMLMFYSLIIDTWNIDAPGGLEFIFGSDD